MNAFKRDKKEEEDGKFNYSIVITDQINIREIDTRLFDISLSMKDKIYNDYYIKKLSNINFHVLIIIIIFRRW